jgi:NADH dehydrogenase (ubiquinone) 1 alpha subcomplex subunit 9
LFPAVPLFDGGHALTQPVYAVNVADAIQKVVDEPEKFEGRTIDCFGPEDYTYKEISEFVYDITMQDPTVVDVPKSVAKLTAKVAQYQGTPMLTPDLVELWAEDFAPGKTQDEYDAQTAADKIYTLKDLGVKPVPIEKVAFNYLHRFRKGGHFSLAKGYH